MSFNLSYILTSIFFSFVIYCLKYIYCAIYLGFCLWALFLFVCFFYNVEVSKTLTGLKVENTIISMNLISLA